MSTGGSRIDAAGTGATSAYSTVPVSAAVSGGVNATPGTTPASTSAPQPVQFSADVISALKNVGLNDGQIGVLKAIAPDQKTLQNVYDVIKADPTAARKIPSSVA